MLLQEFIYFVLIVVPSSLVSTRDLLGAHLTLIVTNSPPHMIVTRESNSSYRAVGPLSTVNEWLSQRFNYTFTMLPLIDGPLVQQVGVNKAVFSTITNMADGCLGLYVMTEDRVKIMDVTAEIWQEPYALIVPAPQEASRLLSFIKPWQSSVWLCIFGSAVIVAIIMRLFSLIYTKFMCCDLYACDKTEMKSLNQTCKERNLWSGCAKRGLDHDIMYVVNTLTNQGFYMPYSPWSFRILASGWLLATLVLVNSYAGTVASYMAIPLVKPSINSLEDLAANTEVSLLVRRDHVITNAILNATSGVLKALGNKVRAYPDSLMDTNAEVLRKLSAGGSCAYIYFKISVDSYVSQMGKENGTCRFHASDPIEYLSVAHFSLLFQKNSKYTSYISTGILELWSVGLLQFWESETRRRSDKCFAKKRKSVRKNTPLKMEDLMGAFFILGIGSGCALLSIFIEIIIFGFVHRDATNKPYRKSIM